MFAAIHPSLLYPLNCVAWDELLLILGLISGNLLPVVTRAQPPASDLGRLRKRDRVLRAGKDLVRRVRRGTQSVHGILFFVGMCLPHTTDIPGWVGLPSFPSPPLSSPPLPSPPLHQIGDLSADLGPLGRHGLRRSSLRRRSSHLRSFPLHK